MQESLRVATGTIRCQVAAVRSGQPVGRWPSCIAGCHLRLAPSLGEHTLEPTIPELPRQLRARQAFIIVSCVLCAAVTRAQGAEKQALPSTSLVFGIVRDSSGAPLQGAEISVSETVMPSATSDDTGAYALRQMPVGRWRVIARRVGFRAAVAYVTVEASSRIELDFTLRSIVGQLPTIKVRDTALVPRKYRSSMRYDAFFLHRATATSGVFLDREQMDRRGGVAHALSSFGGIKATENMGSLAVTLPRCGSGSPVLIVNGVLTNGSALTLIPVSSIELIEVYRSVAEMPVEARGDGCGAIVLYTR